MIRYFLQYEAIIRSAFPFVKNTTFFGTSTLYPQIKHRQRDIKNNNQYDFSPQVPRTKLNNKIM